jgi:hypothetical protein
MMVSTPTTAPASAAEDGAADAHAHTGNETNEEKLDFRTALERLHAQPPPHIRLQGLDPKADARPEDLVMKDNTRKGGGR